nr:hypothetical protein [Lentinula edodes]
MNKNKNNNKKPLISLIEINKKILPFFSNPIILKRINDQKKNKDLNSLNPQKKLIYKIIKLNENLVKFTTSIKNYNLNLDLFFLSNISSSSSQRSQHTEPYSNAKSQINTEPAPNNESKSSYLLVQANLPLIKEDRGFNLQKRLDMNVGNKSEFILFTRNNLYYNLKYRLSNIMYKIEKFIPVLKFYSLLNNINLFVPKRLLKPQPYIRFTYRIIQLNNSFKFKNASSSDTLLQTADLTETLNAKASLPELTLLAQPKGMGAIRQGMGGLDALRLGGKTLRKKGKATLLRSSKVPTVPTLHSIGLKKLDLTQEMVMSAADRRLGSLFEGNTREQVIIKINNYKYQYGNSIIQLHKSENVRSIKYILLKLDSLLNEIENILNIKNKLIKVIKIKNIKNLSNFDRNSLDSININSSSSPTPTQTEPNLSQSVKGKEIIDQKGALTEQRLSEVKHKENSLNQPLAAHALVDHKSFLIEGRVDTGNVGVIAEDRPSNQSVKSLRLKIKTINSNNEKIDTYPLLVDSAAATCAGMVKENKIKIEKNIKSIFPMIQTQPLVGSGSSSVAGMFDAEKDIINENSNPVDLLYFNNNLKKPVINQYLKSMSTYNMITNGTILYYSNIIGFNFKNRIKAYLPFIKSISPISKPSPALSLSTKDLRQDSLGTVSLPNLPLHSSSVQKEKDGFPAYTKNGERLTSPYSFRSLRKVVGSIDKGKFSVFGRGIENNKLINNIYKFLYLSFKSMYCLISKPVFIIKSNKIIIQLFYFLLIPKIFKHIKSKTKYNPIKKNGKRVYLTFVEKRKKQALAALFESRLKEKEDQIKKNYFIQHSLKDEGELNNNTSIMILDHKSAPSLKLTYKNEFVEARKASEKISGVKFDKDGKVKLDSLDFQLDKNPQLRLPYSSNHKLNQFSSLSVNGINTGIVTNEGAAKLKNKTIKSIKNNKIRIKKRSYKMFFKRFEFNNINNDLHILKIPQNWTLPQILALPNGWDYRTAQTLAKSTDLRLIKNYGSALAQPVLREVGNEEGHNRRDLRNRKTKLFKYLALTYLNIFKFKDRRNILNRIKISTSTNAKKKELIKDKTYLLSYNSNHLELLPNEINASPASQQNMEGGIKGNNRRNKFNSYNQINWYLFKKLFWSIRLSKKIIPNAKILQKLGIPQWSWPYSSIKKKGYAISHMSNSQKKSNFERSLNNLKLRLDLDSSIQLKGISKGIGTESDQTVLSYSWPFSLLMSPTITQMQINKKIKLDTDNLNSRIPASLPADDTAYGVKGKRSSITQQGLLLGSGTPSLQSAAERVPVIQKQNRYKIRELYTKRYHLMKLANINLVKIYPLKFEKLCEVLNSIFNKPVELDLIRLHYPYNDSNILVRLLAFMINKMKLRRITRRLFNKAVVKSIKKINNKDQVNIIPAFLSGMTIKVAGRLMKYKVIPRKTVKIVRRGSSSIGKINYSDISRYTNKNKRGSFTITIKSGQNFFN